MTTEKKITNRDYFNALMNIVATVEYDNDGVNQENIAEFLKKQVATLDARNAKVRAKKAEAADTILDAIMSVLGSEPMTGDAIVKAIGIEDITKSKVVPRLTKLIAEGVVSKSEQKVGDRKQVVYSVLA